MKNIIIAALALICCASISMNIILNKRLDTEIADLKETVNYLEVTLETIAKIQTLPEKHYKAPVFQDTSLENRIQMLETQNRQHEDKLKDVERDAYWARSELNNQKTDKGQLYKWAVDKEHQLLNP